MPGINDAPEQVEEIIALATEDGAVSIGGRRCSCAARCGTIFFDWLRSYRPDLVPRYEELYARGALRRRRRSGARSSAPPGCAGTRLTQYTPSASGTGERAAGRPDAGAAATREEVRQGTLF